MKTKVIVNPRAGKGSTARSWPRIQNKLQSVLGRFDAQMTAGVGEATQISRASLEHGYDWIITVGGDGTINEVVNGFFQGDRPVNSEAVLSFLSSGTGGDLRRTLAIPRESEKAIDALARAEVRKVDVGRLSFISHQGGPASRYFINLASFGMSGEVDMRINRMSAPGLMGGSAAFLWATLWTLISFQNKKVRIVVDDSFDQSMKVRLVVAANGQYAGGGMWFAPQARIDDGLFDIIILGDLSRARVFFSMSRIYWGRHLGEQGVLSLRGKKLIADSDEIVYLDVDGEAPGRLPASFEIVPRALSLKC